MKSNLLIPILMVGLSAFVSCQRAAVNPSNPTATEVSQGTNREESMTAYFISRDGIDGQFYDVVPNEYVGGIKTNIAYSAVHLFINEDGTLNYIYEFANETDKQNAGSITCTMAKVKKQHPILGTYYDCEGDGKDCSITVSGNDTTIHWC